MRSWSRLVYRIAAILLSLSLAFTSVGCMSLVERLVPQREPAPTFEPPLADPGTTPVVARPTSRPVPRAERPTGVISTQAAETVASEVIDTSGGTIRVEMPGDPIDGLVLEVAAGSYPDPREFTISSSTIVDHTFGDTFNPLSPLITIENGGDYSDEFMTVTVPIDLPDGWFAMPFYYDESTGRLEGIPFTSLGEDSITVVTRHFSSFTISGILKSHLDELIAKGIDSGFRPGADDWQFTNYGSFIAPPGHCAGQALTALWYYCEQPDGEDPFLWGLYDNNGREPQTPDLWQDDSYGYRLASTVHKDIVWSSFQNKLMDNLRGANDELKFKAFAYGMHLTGEPQEVGIFSSAGGGHDMIVYRVDRNGLAIADPNYPGNTSRRIEYSNGSFSPYHSGANAAEIAAGNGKAYETIQYCAKTATIDWGQIAARWDEFKDGTIGDDLFPSYELFISYEHWDADTFDANTAQPLVDGYQSERKNVCLYAADATAWLALSVYRNGIKIQPNDDGMYELVEGNNLIGISVLGDHSWNPNNPQWKYVNFHYFNVWYGECSGWVLDSIEVREFYAGEDHIGQQNVFFDASPDGWFSSSGQYVIFSGEETVLADYTATGSWTPLPRCIQPDSTVSIELTASSSVIPERPIDWGESKLHLILSERGGQGGGRINHVLRAGESDYTTVIAEFEVRRDYYATFVVTVSCGTDFGVAQYDYTYVRVE